MVPVDSPGQHGERVSNEGRAATSAEWTRAHWGTAVLLLVLGTTLRLVYFAFDTPLWGDEAALALNLRDRTFPELTAPLGENQHAPLVFLWLEKALFDWFGLNERALRFPSLVASVLALPLFLGVLRKSLSRRAALLGLALFALSPGLVRYGAELKPYATDVLATLIVLVLSREVLVNAYSRASALKFAAAGAALVWCSFPVVFVLLASALSLALPAIRDRIAARVVLIGGMAAAWLASFATYFAVVLHHSVARTDLVAFWSYQFAPLPPTTLWEVRRLIEMGLQPFTNPLGFIGQGLPATLWIFGLVGLFRSNSQVAVTCLVSVIATFLASGFHVYPFATRLILFLAPVYLLPIACGAAKVRIDTARWWPFFVISAMLLLTPVLVVNDQLDSPDRSGVRDALSELSTRVKEGDAIYVYYKARLPFALYASRLGNTRVAVVHGELAVREEQRYVRDIAGLAGRRRVWFLFTEVHTFFVDEERLMLSELERRGRRLDEVRVAGTRAYLYDLSVE